MQPFQKYGGAELILILTLLIILFNAKKLPELAKGLGRGLFQFRKAIDDESTEAGRNLGGIYGKPAAQALTLDNQVAELYDPAIFRKDSQPQNRRNLLLTVFTKFVARLRRFLRRNRLTS